MAERKFVRPLVVLLLCECFLCKAASLPIEDEDKQPFIGSGGLKLIPLSSSSGLVGFQLPAGMEIQNYDSQRELGVLRNSAHFWNLDETPSPKPETATKKKYKNKAYTTTPVPAVEPGKDDKQIVFIVKPFALPSNALKSLGMRSVKLDNEEREEPEHEQEPEDMAGRFRVESGKDYMEDIITHSKKMFNFLHYTKTPDTEIPAQEERTLPPFLAFARVTTKTTSSTSASTTSSTSTSTTSSTSASTASTTSASTTSTSATTSSTSASTTAITTASTRGSTSVSTAGPTTSTTSEQQVNADRWSSWMQSKKPSALSHHSSSKYVQETIAPTTTSTETLKMLTVSPLPTSAHLVSTTPAFPSTTSEDITSPSTTTTEQSTTSGTTWTTVSTTTTTADPVTGFGGHGALFF